MLSVLFICIVYLWCLSVLFIYIVYLYCYLYSHFMCESLNVMYAFHSESNSFCAPVQLIEMAMPWRAFWWGRIEKFQSFSVHLGIAKFRTFNKVIIIKHNQHDLCFCNEKKHQEFVHIIYYAMIQGNWGNSWIREANSHKSIA